MIVRIQKKIEYTHVHSIFTLGLGLINIEENL